MILIWLNKVVMRLESLDDGRGWYFGREISSVSQFIRPCYRAKEVHPYPRIARIVRIVRIVRIARIVRIVRVIRISPPPWRPV